MSEAQSSGMIHKGMKQAVKRTAVIMVRRRPKYCDAQPTASTREDQCHFFLACQRAMK